MRLIFRFLPFFVLLAAVSPALAASKTVTVDSHASIATTLELKVSGAQSSELAFGNVNPTTATAGPVMMIIDVDSNSGAAYQVTQTLNGSLRNTAGDQISPDHIKFTSSSTSSIGTVVSNPTEVSSSPQTVYVSDSKGTRDTIAVEYTLQVPPNQAPGSYGSSLTYTASTL